MKPFSKVETRRSLLDSPSTKVNNSISPKPTVLYPIHVPFRPGRFSSGPIVLFQIKRPEIVRPSRSLPPGSRTKPGFRSTKACAISIRAPFRRFL
jgi:hypothetical protein